MSLLPPHDLPTLMLKLVWLGYRRFSGSCHAYLSTRIRWKSILCIALARLGYLPSPKVVKLPFSSLMVRSTILSRIGLASYRLRLYLRNCLLAALRSTTQLGGRLRKAASLLSSRIGSFISNKHSDGQLFWFVRFHMKFFSSIRHFWNNDRFFTSCIRI